jgi:hypothetical protein
VEDLQKIRAVPVVKNKFWILSKNNIKVGQAKQTNKDIEVRIHGETAGKYPSVSAMKDSGLFEFMEMPKPTETITEEVHGFPTDQLAYNAVWNVRYGLPLYTQTAESKTWFAAGYYRVNISGTWIVQYCPKLITLQRNGYTGPYKTDPGINQFNEFFE